MNCKPNKTFAKVSCKMCKEQANISWLAFNDLHLGLPVKLNCLKCKAKTSVGLRDLVDGSVYK